jgi:hypothetical protein
MRVEDFSTQLQAKGDVDLIIDYKNGKQETKYIRNTILRNGRRSLAKALANQIGAEFDFYITRMLFGDGGTNEGVKKYVNADRGGLFGVTRLSKPVLATIDPTIPTQAIFTTVITFDEAVGVVLSEMALQMANGDLYSMTTFPDLTKTEEMQITFNWRLNFV